MRKLLPLILLAFLLLTNSCGDDSTSPNDNDEPIVPTYEVEYTDEAVFINELRVGSVQATDSLGRPMPTNTGCYRLQSGEYFLLSTAIKNSFDSRYFGPVVEDGILGVATPLLIFEPEN